MSRKESAKGTRQILIEHKIHCSPSACGCDGMRGPLAHAPHRFVVEILGRKGEDHAHLSLTDGGEIIEELRNGLPSGETIKQGMHGHPCSGEARNTTHA